MAKLFCKYCSKELIASDSGVKTVNGSTCSQSPDKKHIAIPNPPHCIYCGYELRKAGKVNAYSA
jgi:hypothetical protein